MPKLAGQKGSGHQAKQNPASKLTSIKIQDVVFKVGDSVLVRTEPDEEGPFVGKIKDLKAGKKGNLANQVLVAWYYRPEECQAGRRVFHGEKELFQSNHLDWIDAQTISEKCSVYTLEAYKKLAETSDTEYFTRYTYDPNKHEFLPKEVSVYCCCEFPYNPDVFMLSCGECDEWYHPRCIGLSDEDVGKFDKEPFVCPDCAQKTQSTGERKRDAPER